MWSITACGGDLCWAVLGNRGGFPQRGAAGEQRDGAGFGWGRGSGWGLWAPKRTSSLPWASASCPQTEICRGSAPAPAVGSCEPEPRSPECLRSALPLLQAAPDLPPARWVSHPRCSRRFSLNPSVNPSVWDSVTRLREPGRVPSALAAACPVPPGCSWLLSGALELW